jgi:hypothetical protein
VNFSDLSNRPVETVRKLSQSSSRALRVHRRGEEEDLILTTASRADDVVAVASLTTKILLALMASDDGVVTLVTDVLPAAFPWVRYLQKHEIQAFVVELVGALQGAESLQNPAPVVNAVAAWKATAEVYADPELLHILTRDDGDQDFGPVPEPKA